MKNLVKTKTLALLFSVAGLFCALNAYSWSIDAGAVYFDNTVTNWSKVYLRFGTSNWCNVHEMSKMDGNDNIYYINFNETQNNIEAIQFASVGGYNITDRASCIDQCGIYNGNVIDGGEKTAYIKNSISGSNRLIVATGKTGFCTVSAPQPMPSGVSYETTTFNGVTISADATLGYFTPEQEVVTVTVAGSTNLTYSSEFPSGVSNEVHATFRYALDGDQYSNISCAGSASPTKSFSADVTLPSSVGKYTTSTYYKCGGPESSKITSYYHIIGLTGKDINFGSVKANGTNSKTETETLTDVWGGDNVSSVDATITGTNYTEFKFANGTQSTSITFSDKSGSEEITFTPTGDEGDRAAVLTLTLTYNTSETLVKTYNLSGYAATDKIKVKLGAAAETLAGPKAKLNGYLQYTGCNSIYTYGFLYSSTQSDITGDAPSGGTSIEETSATALSSGFVWSKTIPAEGNLTAGTPYYYRSYVKYGVDTYYSDEIGSITAGDACNYDLSGDTIYMQVDKSFAAGGDSACTLKFRNLQGAIDFIKGSSVFYNPTTKVLNHNIVLEVAPASSNYIGTGTTGKTGGEATDLSTTIIQDINNTSGVTTGYNKSLVIRSSSATQMPTIQHPTIRNSRNITFENVRLTGSTTAGGNGKYDNAVDIDTDNTSWTGLVVGAFANANINFKGCYIFSMGFTCLHISAYDGVTFENCDIQASLPSTMLDDDNTIYWGASVKFIQCKNIKFLRNNFRGSHATSIWVQGVIGLLAMNNVFWNDNKAYNSSYADNGTFFRLVTQQANDDATKANLNQKIGIYYNTLYIAANTDIIDARKFDFIRLGSNYTYNSTALNANMLQNQHSTIRFMYNNCYSYDQSSVAGANQSGTYKWCLADAGDHKESNWCSSICNNNYWSMWGDSYTAQFIIPNTSACDDNVYYTVNVFEQVCSTASDDPGSLVIKGGDLNLGKHITNDVSGLGGENLYNDRLHASNDNDAIRKNNGSWTIGAYQQSEGGTPVETIVWWGDAASDASNWDNRNNWRKLDGTRVTCVDNLATELKVIIPAPNSTTYTIPEGGITSYPTLPNKFSGTRTSGTSETVNAGHGISNPTMFASSIELEYGSSIKGVSSLKDDDVRRYTEVSNHFEAGRMEYILVGTVVKPFTGDDKSDTRLIQSGDYYLGQAPHVYMRQAEVNGEEVNWNVPFTSLEEEVDYNKVFAIMIPDQYGYYKFPAEIYYVYFEEDEYMAQDGSRSKSFDFNGWFLNDAVTPEYKVNGATLLCNTYPANIDVAQAIENNKGSIKYYDYSTKNFATYVSGNKEIKSQNGFLFIPGTGNDGYFRISTDMLLSTNTKYKSADAANPYFIIKVLNNNGDGGSTAAIVYDELKADSYDSDLDLLNTTIDNTSTQPEISVEMYGKELDKVVVSDLTQAIPLKLVCGAKMTVDFGIYEMSDIETATLEDREAGKTYDLLTEAPSIDLAKGTYTGRFYLNLSEAEEPIPTDVEDVTSGDASIDIYGDSKAVIISSSDNVILKGAEITDMAGRTTYVELTGAHYNKVNISGAQGVYVVKAIGDVMSETTKVIVK